MPKYTTDKSIDIDTLIKQSKMSTPFVDEETFAKAKQSNALGKQPQVAARIENEVRQNNANEAPKPAAAPIIPGLILEDEPVETAEPEKEYDGPGIVMTKEEYEKSRGNDSAGITVTSMNQDRMDDVKQYMKEQDAEIERLKKRKEDMEAKGVAPATTTPQNIVNIYIDKARVGDIVLTPEQQKRVELAQKIIVTETSEMNYKTIKIQRKDLTEEGEAKRKNTIIKRAFDRTLSPFVALGSGYLGKMSNCSVAEIMKLGRNIDSGKSLDSELDRWSLLYSKMKYCSIGEFEDFNDFLKNTAYNDYDNLQFAVICASFPTDTTLQFECPKCKTNFNFTVKNRDLLRTDLVTQEIAEHVHDIIDADTFVEKAKEVHDRSWLNQVTRISASEDDNLIMMDLYIPSAYDAIYRTYKELTNPKKDMEDFENHIDMVRIIKAIYIADEDENGEPVYYQFDDVNDIFDIISNFTDDQLNRIAQFVSNSYLAHQYYYGIKDVVCPNKECNHHLGEYPMNMDTLLFHKVRPQ